MNSEKLNKSAVSNFVLWAAEIFLRMSEKKVCDGVSPRIRRRASVGHLRWAAKTAAVILALDSMTQAQNRHRHRRRQSLSGRRWMQRGPSADAGPPKTRVGNRRNLRLQPKSAFLRFPAVRRADLKGQQRVDLTHSPRRRRMAASCAFRPFTLGMITRREYLRGGDTASTWSGAGPTAMVTPLGMNGADWPVAVPCAGLRVDHERRSHAGRVQMR